MNTVVKINDVGQVAIDEANLVEQAIGNAVDHAIKCGAALIAKKAELDHGKFMPWVEVNMPIKRTQCVQLEAGASSGSQSRQGKSQEPCSLSRRQEGNQVI